MTTTEQTINNPLSNLNLSVPVPSFSINSNNLNNTEQSLTLPSYQPDTSGSSLVTSIGEENNSAIKSSAEKAKTDRESSTSDITKLMSDMGVIEGKKGIYEDELGVNKLQKQIDGLQGAIDVEYKSVQDTIDSIYKNPNLTLSLAGRQANEIQRKSASYLANLSLSKSILGRDYDRAVGIAEKKVEMELAPLKSELDAKKFVYESNKELWSASEKAQLDNIIRKEERAYKEEKERKDTLEAKKIELFKNGAPQNMLDVVRDAETIEDIYAIPGVSTYLVSKAERLDMQLKGLQIRKANNDLAPRSEIISLDDAMKYGVPPGTPLSVAYTLLGDQQEKKSELARQTMQDKIANLDSLKEHRGLGAAIGANRTARFTPFTFDKVNGERDDFVAAVDQLVNQETLDTLLELKKSGGTVGSPSDKDIELFKSASSKINSWAVKDKEGKIR